MITHRWKTQNLRDNWMSETSFMGGNMPYWPVNGMMAVSEVRGKINLTNAKDKGLNKTTVEWCCDQHHLTTPHHI